MSNVVGPGIKSPVKRGQEVLAGDEAIGEVLGVICAHDVQYVHVMRYGPGCDELYIPTGAIDRVVGNHVYLHLNAADLLGQPWHECPEVGTTPGRTVE